jgi:hypothetical protein
MRFGLIETDAVRCGWMIVVMLGIDAHVGNTIHQGGVCARLLAQPPFELGQPQTSTLQVSQMAIPDHGCTF